MPDGAHGEVWPLDEVERRFGPWIRTQVRRLFPRDWDDVAQDVMLKLAQALPRIRDGKIEAARAFVSRTVRSVCIDEWRRRAQRPRASDLALADVADPAAAAPVQSAIGAESRERLRRAWDALPARERTILKLRFDDGLGFREIAEVLSVPQGSVAGWYSRALASLREGLR
jgi:RNA polymerase sigma-70 factor (ECF subfamily)